MYSVLIVDDEKNTYEGLKEAFEEAGFKAYTAKEGKEALSIIQNNQLDCVITDMKMPGMDGLTLLENIQKGFGHIPVLLLTAYGTVDHAVEAMKRGAYDFLTKPVNLDKLILTAQRAIQERAVREENARLKNILSGSSITKFQNIVGASVPMKRVYELIQKIAPTRSTVLICGESGTGKELVAQAIHAHDKRTNAPFVAVHCAALTETLLESELFGHEKGSYTGATERTAGRFEMADNGTIFLDEISEISPKIQAKLLRVLQQREFERVGSTKTIKIDVRIIAATNVNLEEAVRKGTFREDLYFRLNVLRIDVPPLRERKEDIPLLVDHFLREFSFIEKKTVSQDTLKLLAEYDWPGNIRELRNYIERAVILSKGNTIKPQDISINFLKKEEPSGAPSLDVKYAERDLIFRALKECSNNKSKAAKVLGLSRRTLHRKLNEYGASPE